MRVLVVEDDRVLGQFLQKGLVAEGHQVQWVGDGEAALLEAEVGRPDLMVLDLGLPGVDGKQVLAEVKEKFTATSVIVLSGRSNVQERIECLQGGADDYVLKPFSLHELVARCEVVLRRKSQLSEAVLRHGELEIHRVDRSVRRAGREIELTAKEYALLEFLMLRHGANCSRRELLEGVWHVSTEATTNIVDVYVNYLRKKLAAAQPAGLASSPVIETVRGTGYRLCAEKKLPMRPQAYTLAAAVA